MKLKKEMYNLKSNNYNLKPKNSTIYTPPAVSQFIFELLKDKIEWKWNKNKTCRGVILDPCSGKGSLLQPWKENDVQVWGNDNDPELLEQKIPDSDLDFLTSEKPRYRCQPTLILCNPPFNGYGNKLGSEVWLAKIIELFGKDIPIVLFAPVGFCSNLTLESKRLEKFNNGTYPPIVSRITLPKNIFEGVIFHSEILIFNIKGLKGHYFLPKC